MLNILFVTNNMPFGGVERALIDNIKVLQGLGHKVDLLLREKQGGFLSQIPSGVDIIELPLSKLDRYEVEYGRVPTLKYMLSHGHWFFAVRMLLKRLAWVLSGRRKNYDYEVVRSAVARTPQTLVKVYDLAIAYSADFPWSTIITLNWVSAKCKITWCHNEHCYNRVDAQLFDDYYSRFDAHYACSQMTANRINKALNHPDLVKGFPHLVDASIIRDRGSAAIDDPRFNGHPIILTAGRVGEQKASDSAVRIYRKLKDAGFAGKWFWIGNGNRRDEENLVKQIQSARVEDGFVFLGSKQNPYPYIKACDLYVQPSRYEGYCLTVAEARIFNRPIIATDFDGARDQLKNGITGIIVPEGDEEAVTNAIQSLLGDDKQRIALMDHLSKENPDTQKVVRQAWSQLMKECA